MSLLFSTVVFGSASAQDNAEIYLLDGFNTSFAWGRHVSFDKIAVGLSNEGIYELRNDTIVMLVDFPGRPEERICKISTDFMSGNKVFEMQFFDGLQFVTADTLGIYDPERSAVLDKTGKKRGDVEPSGKILSPRKNVLLSFNARNVDPTLVAFFFLYHYTPRNKRDAE